MTLNDIRKMFSDKVASLMSEGYSIFPDTMSGSQGEVAKVDLIKGSEVVRVLLETSFGNYGMYGSCDNCLMLTVGKHAYTGPKNWRKGALDTWTTIWNNELELMYCEKFFSYNAEHDYWVTEEEALRNAEVYKERMLTKAERYRNKIVKNLDVSKVGNIVLPFVRRHYRMKTAKLSDIESVVKVTNRDKSAETPVQYVVVAKGVRMVMC